MTLPLVALFAIFASSHVSPKQIASAGSSENLPTQTTLPIRFSRGVDAGRARAGDLVEAKTTQVVILPGGEKIPEGSRVVGHVVSAQPFVFDKTPYAKQKESNLTVHFDNVSFGGHQLPLNVYVRALADPINSWDASKPKASDEDSLGTTTQVGGDLVTPSQAEVLSQRGDVVGYHRHGGVYAHLVAATGNSPDGCDASDKEVSMGIYSASACGLYGYTDTTLQRDGRGGDASTLVLTSHRHAPKIRAGGTALLEALPVDATTAAR